MKWIKPSENLEARILNKIASIQRQRLFYKLALDCLACFVFFVLGVFSSISAWQVLSSTTFKSLLSLAGSDWPIIAAHWQDFSYSILEILPVTAIFIFCLALSFLLFFSRDLAIKQGLLKRA